MRWWGHVKRNPPPEKEERKKKKEKRKRRTADKVPKMPKRIFNAEVFKYGRGCWLESEEAAYPTGSQTRRGVAIYPDGKLRRVWAGIADTFYSTPAHGKVWHKGQSVYVAGFLTVATVNGRYGGELDGLRFHVYEKYAALFEPQSAVKQQKLWV